MLMCLSCRFKFWKISSNRWLWLCQLNHLFESFFTGLWSLEFIIYDHQHSLFVHQFLPLTNHFVGISEARWQLIWEGRWCLCEQMSVFLHAGRRSSLSVCINELAVMFDHHAYHSHFQNSISKARQSCPWEVSFCSFLIGALIRWGKHIVFV